MVILHRVLSVLGLLVPLIAAHAFPAGYHAMGEPSFDPDALAKFKVWNDGPQPQETVGWISHHSSIRVSSFEASMAFYTQVLGFRHIWTNNLEFFKLGYLAYPAGGKNGTGFQTGKEMFRSQTNREGILELIWFKDGDPITANGQGFSHLGFVVPNVRTAAKYLNTHNVKWIRAPDTNLSADILPVFGLTRYKTVPKWLQQYFAADYCMFADPDGYVIEILPAGGQYQ